MYGLQKFDNSKFREDLLLRLRNTDTEGSDTSFLDILWYANKLLTIMYLKTEVRRSFSFYKVISKETMKRISNHGHKIMKHLKILV